MRLIVVGVESAEGEGVGVGGGRLSSACGGEREPLVISQVCAYRD